MDLWIFETETVELMYADAMRVAQGKHTAGEGLARAATMVDALRNDLIARGALPMPLGWLPV
jgi:hypothetical protein